MTRILHRFGLIKASAFNALLLGANKAETDLARAKATIRTDTETIETLRTKLRDLGQEYADYRAAAEDRFAAIAALETPKANATARNMAKLARGSAE